MSEHLKTIPKEEVWLASRKSTRTRHAYHDHRTVMTWEQLMREEEGKEAMTGHRRLAVLFSLFAHLVKFGSWR
jgi:hypothetical protein